MIDGCGNVTYDTVRVTILPPIVADISVPDTIVNPNTPIFFANHSTGAKRWVWSFGDGTIDTTASPTHSFDSLCSTCIVTLSAYQNDSLYCSDCITKVVRVNVPDRQQNPTGGNKSGDSCISGLQVKPNPFPSDYIDIAFNASPGAPISLRIYDEIGKLVYEESLPGTGGAISRRLTLPGIGSGAHFLRLSCSAQETVVKLFTSH
jgi:hypothetical protein